MNKITHFHITPYDLISKIILIKINHELHDLSDMYFWTVVVTEKGIDELVLYKREKQQRWCIKI